MNITAKVFAIKEPKGAKVGTASITIQHEKGGLVVTGYGILKGSNGFFVVNPQRKATEWEVNNKKDKNGYVDISFSLTKELREEIQNVILDAFSGKDQSESGYNPQAYNQNNPDPLPF